MYLQVAIALHLMLYVYVLGRSDVDDDITYTLAIEALQCRAARLSRLALRETLLTMRADALAGIYD